MSNAIQTFNFESQSITTAVINGEIFFHATELARVLGFGNPRQAIASHIDKEDVQKLDTLTKGGKQQVTFTNESGMYALIFGSTKDEAKRFKRWVTSEVLPSIRKTGQYRHTLSTAQQAQIQKCVRQKCKDNSTHYQTIYTALKDKFKVPSYKDILASEFDEALAFIVGFEFVSSYNLALIQNILADADHQTKKARDEFDQIMIAVHHLLEHMQNLQIRLDISERNIGALRTRFIA